MHFDANTIQIIWYVAAVVIWIVSVLLALKNDPNGLPKSISALLQDPTALGIVKNAIQQAAMFAKMSNNDKMNTAVAEVKDTVALQLDKYLTTADATAIVNAVFAKMKAEGWVPPVAVKLPPPAN